MNLQTNTETPNVKIDKINIFLSGLSGVGKSTLTNALIGQNLSKIKTDKPSMYVIDPHYNNPIETFRNYEDFSIVVTKQSKQNLFLNDLKISIFDTVGNNKKLESMKKHKTIKNFNSANSFCTINNCDVLLTVIDINSTIDQMEKNLEQLKHTTNGISHYKKSILHIILVNKCDRIVYTNNTWDMDPSDKEKYIKIRHILLNNGYNTVMPISAEESMLFSNGINGHFKENSEYLKHKYQIDSQNGELVENLLMKYGLKCLIDKINKFVVTNANSIHNRRIVNQIKSNECTIQQTTELLDKLVSNGDENIIEVVDLISKQIEQMIPHSLKNENEYDMIQNLFNDLGQTFKKKTNVVLDCSNKCELMIKQMRMEFFQKKIESEWCEKAIEELYKMNKLDKQKFCNCLAKELSDEKFGYLIKKIMYATNYDINYIYYSLCELINAYPTYIVFFKMENFIANTTENLDLNIIRLQLLKKYDFDCNDQLDRNLFNMDFYAKKYNIYCKIMKEIIETYANKDKNDEPIQNDTQSYESVSTTTSTSESI